MFPDVVTRLRSFNRTVTERVGALEVQYLGRQRPLGESRLLWEIGDDGRDVRDLRRRLGLDSGYLSRLLRSLEVDRLVTVDESAADGRVRTARLTDAGRRERAEIDRLSDELALSILEPLDESQRVRLAEAAETVDRLLRASLVTVAAEDPAGPDARWCLEQYFAELAERFEGGFDREAAIRLDDDDMRLPRGLILIAWLRGRPVGCGVLRLQHAPGAPPELKRMWVEPGARGLGLGRRLLRELELRAAEAGASSVRLETNRSLVEAIRLYGSSGYEEVPAFNDEPHAHHWFEKRLI